MIQKRAARLLLSATVISTFIQVPFLLMLNKGIHSWVGGFGFLFYYPWIIFPDHFGTQALWRWESNFFIFKIFLFILQSFVLVPMIAGLFVFRDVISKKEVR